jgi:alkylation response protein AidB-like acyl-CoA dehydrogenase
MELEELPEERALRATLRAYYAELLTDDVRAGLSPGGEGGPRWREVVRRIGKDGWLGIGWPTRYGGQGRPATEQYVFFDETRRAGAPFPFVTVTTVGPTLMRHGTEEQKTFFLPRILAGEAVFAIGYTEPGAGTDLASLSTKAVRDGDEYVIEGQKVFTSGADVADYIWLAVRTDSKAPKHQGISIICVPTDAPGFSWTPIRTIGDLQTTATYYDGVRVPVSMRVGAEHRGWELITTQLNHERVGLAAWSGVVAALLEEVRQWAARAEAADGRRVVDLPWVRADLARAYAIVRAMWLLNWRLAVEASEDRVGAGEASGAKVFGTERALEVYRLLGGVLGAAGALRPGSKGAALAGRLERAERQALVNTFGGGVNEVQRELFLRARFGIRSAR